MKIHPVLAMAAIILAVALINEWRRPPPVAAQFCVGGLDDNTQRVVMLSTSWCPYCKEARQWFESNAIAWCEIDVETTALGAELYRRFDGLGTPILIWQERAVSGFDPDAVRDLLAAD